MLISGCQYERKENVLETPGGLHGCHAGTNQSNADHNTTHPNMRTQSGHDQIGRQIEHHVADVKQRQTGRDLVLIQVQHTCKIMTGVLIHCLRQANVRSNGRAHKINHPESRNDAPVQFAFHYVRWVQNDLECRDSPVDALDVFLTELAGLNLVQLSGGRGALWLFVDILRRRLLASAHVELGSLG